MTPDPYEGLATLPTLTTGAFTLRALTLADTPQIFAMFADPEVTRYWGHSTMREPSEAEDFIRKTVEGFARRDLLEWGVTRAGEDRVIGTCALISWSREHRRAEIGYALRRDCWGQGIMAEILPFLLRYGFDTFDLHRIEADVDPRNHASIRSLERLGFQREGYLRERYHTNGETQDTVFYGLLRRDMKESD